MAAKRITDLLAAAALAGTELFEVAQLSDTVTITATTISAAAADNSYNDSANGFVAAGFADGDRVQVAGFTGDVANNILVGTVDTAAAGKLTILAPEGDVIVDDAAGESVTITKWVTRRCTAEDIVNLLLSDPDTLTLIEDTVAGLTGLAPDLLVPSDIAGTTYTIQDTDRYVSYRLTNAAGCTVILPLNATEAVPIGARIRLIVLGAGGLTVDVEDPSIDVISEGDFVIADEKAIVELYKSDTDEWCLLGNFTS